MVRKGYVQLVNSFYMNRKVRKLRHTCPSAIGAFTMMLTFCGDNLSDGHISEDDAFYVLDITDSEIDALCEVGMIEPDGKNTRTPEHQKNYLKIIQLPLPPRSRTSVICLTVSRLSIRRTGLTGKPPSPVCSWRSIGRRS